MVAHPSSHTCYSPYTSYSKCPSVLDVGVNLCAAYIACHIDQGPRRCTWSGGDLFTDPLLENFPQCYCPRAPASLHLYLSSHNHVSDPKFPLLYAAPSPMTASYCLRPRVQRATALPGRSRDVTRSSPLVKLIDCDCDYSWIAFQLDIRTLLGRRRN